MLAPAIRAACEADAAAISVLCQRAIRETNAKDYPADVIERIAVDFVPSEILRRMGDRKVFAAVEGTTLVGTISLGVDKVHSVFVAPDRQRQAIGTRLMAFIEDLARSEGRQALALSSSLTAVPFYASAGYVIAGREVRQNVATVLMVKLIE